MTTRRLPALRVLATTLALGLVAGAARGGGGGEDDWLRPIGGGKVAAPQRIQGGESFPPLPLPATPLRRTERKRPPAPPLLVGKVVWGAAADFAFEDGSKLRVEDWNMCPADAQQLLKGAAKVLGVEYRADTVRLSSFDPDPLRTPVLYVSGGRRLAISGDQEAVIRRFVMAGGMVWFDAIAGSPFFTESVRALCGRLFPEEPLRELPPEHPVYHMAADAVKASLPPAAGTDRPALEGVYVGCRVAVVLSKFGMGGGWDNAEPTLIPGAIYYDPRSAKELGLNLVSYALGYAALGRSHARPELFGDDDGKAATDEFVFAQVRHGGVWNTDPGGPGNLLKALAVRTNAKVTLRRRTVDPAKDDLSGLSFLYVSGIDAFSFPDEAVTALKAFVARGGTILFDASLGLPYFTGHVRREIRRIVPFGTPRSLPPGHALWSSLHRIDRVTYTPALRRERPDLDAPYLEGIEVDGRLAVIVSPYDLGGGWQGDDHPLSRGYSPADAIRVGENIVLHAMTR